MAIDFTCQTLKSKCNRKAKRKKEKKLTKTSFAAKTPPSCIASWLIWPSLDAWVYYWHKECPPDLGSKLPILACYLPTLDRRWLYLVEDRRLSRDTPSSVLKEARSGGRVFVCLERIPSGSRGGLWSRVVVAKHRRAKRKDLLCFVGLQMYTAGSYD